MNARCRQRRIRNSLGAVIVVVGFLAGAQAQQEGPALVGPPEGAPALGPGPQVLRLQWQAQNGAVGYEVRVRRQGQEFDDYTGVVRQTQMRFGTTREGAYEWQVRCLYGDPDRPCATPENALGPWSRRRQFSLVRDATGTPAGPQAPRWRFPEDGQGLVDGNVYRFRWDESPGAFQYQVCHQTPSGTRTHHFVGEAKWEFRACRWMGGWGHGEPEEGTHQLQVRAVGPQGPGPWGEPVQFRLQGQGGHGDHWSDAGGAAPRPVLIAPAANATLNPTPDGLVGVLSWQAVADAVMYEVKFQASDGGHMQEMDHAQHQPPAGVLVEGTRYALVIPQPQAGARYVWQVRAVFADGNGNLSASRFSTGRPFTIGTISVPPIIGEPVALLQPEDGARYTGPEALVPFSWTAPGGDLLCQVAVRDETGGLYAQNYLWADAWDATLVGLGRFTWSVRTVLVAADGTIAALGPVGETRAFVIEEDVTVAGARELGDLVFDGAVDSGDAVRALRRSGVRDQDRIRLRDHITGDCNGDGEIDSGDAVYMLRKAVARNRE